MACFIVPAAEAIAVTAATKLLGHKKAEKNSSVRTLFVTEKLGWLNKMLWGGSALLAFEHLWHGEVVPFFPFLSAMESAEETASMLHEMGTVGAGMALMVTGVWIGMVAVSRVLEKKALREAKSAGSDAEMGKTTYPSLMGLDRSRELAQEFAEKAVDSLSAFSGQDAAFLKGLALMLVTRNK